MHALDCRHHVLDQLLDVRSARGSVVHNEVRVHLRDARAADAMSLEAGGIDQPRRVIARRVREHRAARPLADRLRRLATREQQADVFIAHAGTLLEGEARAEEPLVRRAADVAITCGVVARGSLAPYAGAIDRRDAEHVPPGLAAESARVHCQRAAQRARNAGEEFSRTEAPLDALL